MISHGTLQDSDTRDYTIICSENKIERILHNKNEYICVRSYFFCENDRGEAMKKEVFYGEENQVEEKECVEERKETDKKQEDNQEVEEKRNEEIRDFGQAILHANRNDRVIYLLSIIGEIEGHECLPSNAKTTKYEHVLPKLAAIEDDSSVDGVLLILNTMGGDVESGLAIAEMIASMSKPTVSLVLGGSHSIGVPLAVATDYSFIVPSGTMVIHPVRMSGTVIGARQTYDYFKQMQDRIIGFITSHCKAKEQRVEEMMMNTQMLTKDLGTILVGKEAVKEGIIDAVGGISDAFARLYHLIEKYKS